MEHSQISNKEHQVAVVMVPLWEQGHLNQLLHLSRLVSAHKIPVYYIATATHNRQARTRAHGFDPSSLTNLHFHDFPTPSFPNLSPNPNSSNKFPSHLFPMIKASMNLREPIFNLVKELSDTVGRVVVIYDSLMAYVVQDMKSLANVESYCFHSISAFTLFSFYWENAGKPIVPTEVEVVLRELPSMEGCLTQEFLEFSEMQREVRKSHHGNLFNSNREIESLYLDMLEKLAFLGGEKHFAIGPFNPVEKKDPKSRIERVVRKLMESGEGDETRQRAKELARGVAQSVMEGGPTRLEMDLFIAHITR
ncbi:hypothetical protein BUALT_Bualt12G0022900 [Buddleja alternifolia]|uniref:Glycosyltransferase N-terminal domain-containing protein n=1 Tax=Buddleja alternifolia TaxID=168488 RepID=A0AAV6WV86_9LAMI|nr:hypothetical protein BUALT_Bualt12G0022900 [Buddleja alternifolia]